MPNLRKMQIAIDFYGKIGHLCGVITQKLAGGCFRNFHRQLKIL